MVSTKENGDGENREHEGVTLPESGMDEIRQTVSSSSKPPRRWPRMALSKAESLLLSNTGDVVVCRCKTSSYPPEVANGYKWEEEVAFICCENECDDFSRQLQDSALCSPWSRSHAGGRSASDPGPRASDRPLPQRGGLLGGAPADVASPLTSDRLLGGGSRYGINPRDVSPENDANFSNRAQKAFRSQPLQDTGFDEESIVPILSFDYSHFAEGGNDMIPTPKEAKPVESKALPTVPQVQNSNDPLVASQQILHGVPTFLPSFLNVKISQVSAHPLGSHVLLISDAGLLYSYGLNDYGQLGIGLKTHVRGFHRGFVMTPTIVTPLVENGGKAINCAAGVSHSLVVVQTEERRLVRASSDLNGGSTRSRLRSARTESLVHHQVYGFGRNDYMKIGLVSPKMAEPGSDDEMEAVLLPRRVALRCKVIEDDEMTPDQTQSEKEWPPSGVFAVAASEEHSAALVRRSSGDFELYTWGNGSYGALGLLQPAQGLERQASAPSQTTQHPIRVVPVPSFVASLSRTSYPSALPTSLSAEQGEFPVGITLGKRCTFVLTSLGRCFSFGESEDGMLGLGMDMIEAHHPMEIPFPSQVLSDPIAAISAGATHVLATTRDGNVYTWGQTMCAGVKAPVGPESIPPNPEDGNIAWLPQPISGVDKIVESCAGFDCSYFLSESGAVKSCGVQSGRLGLGEVDADVGQPRPLFGGLALWRNPPGGAVKVVPRPKLALKRGLTIV